MFSMLVFADGRLDARFAVGGRLRGASPVTDVACECCRARDEVGRWVPEVRSRGRGNELWSGEEAR